jgi:hypothetical protein
VGFVEDHGSAVGKDAGIGRAFGFEFDGEVGEKQMVIDDDDVALGARRRISVMKQRSYSLHFWPRQVSARASSLCQRALVSGSSASSARSPVCVVFSHAAMAR